MFTGIIVTKGKITEISQLKNEGLFLKVAMPYFVDSIALGTSISHNGICLTVIDKGKDWLAYDASRETINCTTIGYWKVGDEVNIEPALKIGEELGGHIVLGHVDGITTIKNITPVENSYEVTFELPQSCAPYIAAKGSVTIDGVSLTVNEVDDIASIFKVMIVPHTWKHTVFSDYFPGNKVNLEIDPIARYIARYMNFSK